MRCALSRRVFVRALGRVAASATLLPWLACELESSATESNDGDADGELPEPPSALCLPFMTATEDFFRQFGASRTVDGWSMPALDSAAVLRIEGLIAQPLELTLAELERDSEHHHTVLKTMMCVLGWRSTALFKGVPLRVLLDRAGIDRSAAKRVRFLGADGFENNLKVSDIYDGPAESFEPLIAFQINGEHLPQALGFPFRLLLNDRFGFKNTKWLLRIEVSAQDAETGQYQELGYPDAGVIEPVSTVENLRTSETVAAGAVELCGFALSGRAGIDRVEVSLDGGDFVPAALGSLEELLASYPQIGGAEQLIESQRYGFPPLGVWVQWRSVLELGPGTYRVTVRVVDRAGHSAADTTLTLNAQG